MAQRERATVVSKVYWVKKRQRQRRYARRPLTPSTGRLPTPYRSRPKTSDRTVKAKRIRGSGQGLVDPPTVPWALGVYELARPAIGPT